MKYEFPGTKVNEYCDRLGSDWRSLAVVLEIAAADQNKWDKGHEALEIFYYLKARDLLDQFVPALRKIDRHDLEVLFTTSSGEKEAPSPESAIEMFRNQVSVAVKDEDPVALASAKTALSKLSPQDDSLLLCQAFEAYWHFMDVVTYKTEAEKERKLRRRKKTLESGITDLRKYLESQKSDAEAWILYGKMTRASYRESDKLGWYKVAYEAMSEAIDATPYRQDLQFYRAEVLATQSPCSKLTTKMLKESCGELFRYLVDNPEHARGFRLLSELLQCWHDHQPEEQVARARDLSLQLAQEGDGSWRQRYGPWALRRVRVLGGTFLLLLPIAIGLQFVAFVPSPVTAFVVLLTGCSFIAAAHFLVIYLTSLRHTPYTQHPFYIETTQYEDREETWTMPRWPALLWPPCPDATALQEDLKDAIDELDLPKPAASV